MEIRNLKNVPLSEVVNCITESFADYFVPMPDDPAYWEQRFRAARVDFELSFGIFDETGRLKGFIINGIDELNGIKTAFNSGTGVTSDVRGLKLVDKLYGHAIPLFREKGIRQCMLEVILQNERAIHVYKRIGFNLSRKLHCFKGTLTPSGHEVRVEECPFGKIEKLAHAADSFYSWDNTTAAVKAAGGHYRCYEVYDGDRYKGYFIINPATGHLVQFETSHEDDLMALLDGIAEKAPTVRINNVDSSRQEVVAALLNRGLDNFIDQYEMQMRLS